ncbi:MAG: hypothetical protein MUC99_07290 [Anaerolineae bacterium]|jgi:hypothetical protein|nr:hypothetical protein [Anaerolineae bacterium]
MGTSNDNPAPTGYRVSLYGHHDGFDGLTCTHEPDGTTTLSGVVDQAALHRLLRTIRDSGIVLLSVTRLPDDSHDLTH